MPGKEIKVLKLCLEQLNERKFDCELQERLGRRMNLCKAVVAGLIVTHLIGMGDVPVRICLNESEECSRWMMCG